MRTVFRALVPFFLLLICLAGLPASAASEGPGSEPGAIIVGPSQAPAQSAAPPPDITSLPEAGVPVTPEPPPPEPPPPEPEPSSAAPPAESKPASSKPPAASKPQSKPASKKPADGSSASSEVSSALPEPPSSALPVSSTPEIVLPNVSVDSGDDGKLIDSEVIPPVNNRRTNWIGIIAWVCIALGILVVLIVVLSNRHPPRGGNGRKRYRKPKKSKKHLLNDKYYRNL